jgi:hypothetical protein
MRRGFTAQRSMRRLRAMVNIQGRAHRGRPLTRPRSRFLHQILGHSQPPHHGFYPRASDRKSLQNGTVTRGHTKRSSKIILPEDGRGNGSSAIRSNTAIMGSQRTYPRIRKPEARITAASAQFARSIPW